MNMPQPTTSGAPYFLIILTGSTVYRAQARALTRPQKRAFSDMAREWTSGMQKGSPFFCQLS